jgi:hypothetical protein
LLVDQLEQPNRIDPARDQLIQVADSHATEFHDLNTRSTLKHGGYSHTGGNYLTFRTFRVKNSADFFTRK